MIEHKDDDYVVVFERASDHGQVRLIKVVVSAINAEHAIISARASLSLKVELWNSTRVGQVYITQVLAKPEQA